MSTVNTTNLAIAKAVVGSGEPANGLTLVWQALDSLDHDIGASSSGGLGTAYANSTTETALHTLTIAANDAAVGSAWRMSFWAQISSTGTPTLTLRSRIGWVSSGVPGTIVTSTVVATSTLAGVLYRVDLDLVAVTVGASATWLGDMQVDGNTGVADVIAAATATAGPQASNVAVTWALTAQWSAANAANTTQRLGAVANKAVTT